VTNNNQLARLDTLTFANEQRSSMFDIVHKTFRQLTHAHQVLL